MCLKYPCQLFACLERSWEINVLLSCVSLCPEYIPIRLDCESIPQAFKWHNYHINRSANVRTADLMHLLLFLPPHFTCLLFSYVSCCVDNLDMSNMQISTICAVLKSRTKAVKSANGYSKTWNTFEWLHFINQFDLNTKHNSDLYCTDAGIYYRSIYSLHLMAARTNINESRKECSSCHWWVCHLTFLRPDSTARRPNWPICLSVCAAQRHKMFPKKLALW